MFEFYAGVTAVSIFLIFIGFWLDEERFVELGLALLMVMTVSLIVWVVTLPNPDWIRYKEACYAAGGDTAESGRLWQCGDSKTNKLIFIPTPNAEKLKGTT